MAQTRTKHRAWSGWRLQSNTGQPDGPTVKEQKMDNTQIVLKSRPRGMVALENFEVRSGAAPTPAEGQLLVKNLYLSVDPYMRGRMNAAPSYAANFEVGEVVPGRTVGRVVATRNPSFAEGDVVLGGLGWENYSLTDGSGLRKLPEDAEHLSAYLGVLGMPGFTGYYGLLEIGRPRSGETVYVSGAGGAVGSVVGQVAKLKGCRVVGSAGSDEKVAYLLELGFDAAFNYRTVSSLREAVASVCPSGLDIYFDNVGGDTLEAALAAMNSYGRIVACGSISRYNDAEPRPGPSNLFLVVTRRLTIQGFIISDHEDHRPAFETDMERWLAAGELRYRETVTEGIESAPEAFLRLFTGAKIGKQIVRVG